MDLWEPRRVMTLAQARRRSSLVGLLRMLFMAGAAISAGALVGPVVMHAFVNNVDDRAPPAAGVTMLNPRFTGFDSEDRPFNLTADTARRSQEDVNIIFLENPVLEDGVGAHVDAKSGVFNRTESTLSLDGDVNINDTSGYKFRTQNALVFLNENRVEGVTPLVGVGPSGRLRADSYSVLDNGEKIVLVGNVWTRFEAADE